MTQPIYHLCRQDDWETCRDGNAYKGSEAALSDGFLHLSTHRQVVKSANLHMAGFDDLLLIACDPDKLGDSLKWEKSRSGALFPHIYGLVADDAVINVRPVPRLANGDYDFSAFPDIEETDE